MLNLSLLINLKSTILVIKLRNRNISNNLFLVLHQFYQNISRNSVKLFLAGIRRGAF